MSGVGKELMKDIILGTTTYHTDIHKGFFYKFHEKYNFALLYADCGDYSAYLGYAIWCRNQGYYETAYEYLKIAVHDRSGLSRLEMARVCFVLGRYEEAIQYSEMFQNEKIYSYNYYQGLAYYKLGQKEKCIEIMKEVADSVEENVGSKEARAFLENGLGVKQELDANKIMQGIYLDFKEAPMAHIKYLAIAIPLALFGVFVLMRIFALLGWICIIPLVYYTWLKYSRKNNANYTVDNIDKLARQRNPHAKCKVKTEFMGSEYDLFSPLSKSDLKIPKEKDYKDTGLSPFEERDIIYQNHVDTNAFLEATEQWEKEIVDIINGIRMKRINILLDKYSKGEKKNIVTDALKYLFNIEMVNGEVRYIERTLPYGCASDLAEIEIMQQKTVFADEK